MEKSLAVNEIRFVTLLVLITLTQVKIHVYNVEFGDGEYGSYTANIIIEDLSAHVDGYGRTSSMLKGIINFRMTDEAIQKSGGWTTLPTGVRKQKIITKGVNLEVKFIDGTASWISSKDLK